MKVGRLGEEVGEKVKSAIKAKLMELGIHIDNELPDYVMVLVANKKTQKQMEDDLLLFLGANTKTFTDWLHDVLKKLEEVTGSVKVTKKRFDEKKSKSRRRSIEGDDDMDESIIKKFKMGDLSGENNEETLSDLEHELKESIERSNLPFESSLDVGNIQETADGYDYLAEGDNAHTNKIRERIKIVWDENDKEDIKKPKELHTSRNSKSRVQRKEDPRKYRERSKSPRTKKMVDARDILKKRGIEKIPNERRKKEPSSVVEKPMVLSSVLKTIVREAEKAPPSVPSLVTVTPRPVRPPSMQPSSTLILKAVADAEKSVATSKINQKVVETPEEPPQLKRHLGAKRNISITLLNDRISTNIPDIYPEKTVSPQYSSESNDVDNVKNEDDTISMVLDSEDYIESMDSQDFASKKHLNNGTNGTEHGKRFIISLDNTASDNEVEIEGEAEVIKMEEEKPEIKETEEEIKEEIEEKDEFDKPTKTPFDRTRLGPKVDIDFIPISTSGLNDMLGLEMETENSEGDGLKNKTKCKFWPACDAGDECIYFHPATLCRMFPSCGFGDKCLYIHPACKFADNCFNKSCPYTHTSSTPKPTVPSRTPSAPVSAPSSQICIYFPKCTKPFCPFLHVAKPCRFGTSCSKVGCEFTHPGSKNPYKWVANQ